MCYPLQDICYPLHYICYPLYDIFYPLHEIYYPLRDIFYPLHICFPLHDIRYPLRICYPLPDICYPLHDICYPLVFTTKNVQIDFIHKTALVKSHGIPQGASTSYVLDLIKLLNNGWPEDGVLDAEHEATPNNVCNITLALCLTDCGVDTR
jgi:hypothetical protein